MDDEYQYNNNLYNIIINDEYWYKNNLSFIIKNNEKKIYSL